VEFEHDAKISLLDFVELENYLSDLLGVKVDLVEKSALKPRIGKRILSEVVYLWGRLHRGHFGSQLCKFSLSLT